MQLRTITFLLVVSVLPACEKLRKTSTAAEPEQASTRDEWGAITVLRNYIAEPRWQERAKYCRDTERIRPYMADYYSDALKPYKNEGIQIFAPQRKELEHNEYVVLQADWHDLAYNRKMSTKYVVCKQQGEYKVDWEASVGYNPMKLGVFMAKRDDNAEWFRAVCSLDSYYNYEYRDTKATHLSVRIVADGKSLHGYVSRNNVIGEKILALLRDGKERQMMLALRYIDELGQPLKNSDSQGSVAQITWLVSTTWVQYGIIGGER